MTIELTLAPLTSEAFSPFGDVIELSNCNNILPINYGLTERHHALAEVDLMAGTDAKAIISLFDCTPIALPFQIKVIERHPLGSQAFLPMHKQDYIVVVAPPGEFVLNNLRAFKARADQGVNYHKGTWHHFCLVISESLALKGKCIFAVVDRSGSGNNCDEIFIDDDTVITITS